MNTTDTSAFVKHLLNRFFIEYKTRDHSGIYGYTQKLFAYNSNKIENNNLTLEQISSLFDSGILPKSQFPYQAKDIEETRGHFLMFIKMLSTFHLELDQSIIRDFHYEFKSGVFEDRTNGYAIGDYKKRPNIIGIHQTTLPSQVPEAMTELLSWYHAQDVSLETLAEFHARYEIIHPFQDGNGRTGRIILFRECLRHDISPFIIEDANRPEYLEALKAYRQDGTTTALIALFQKEQKFYFNQCEYFFAE